MEEKQQPWLLKALKTAKTFKFPDISLYILSRSPIIYSQPFIALETKLFKWKLLPAHSLGLHYAANERRDPTMAFKSLYRDPQVLNFIFIEWAVDQQRLFRVILH